ncbi:DUF4446 family protein [Patescibacteria group bacterium]
MDFLDLTSLFWPILGLVVTWQVLLSILFGRLFFFFKKLTKGVSKADLRSILETVLENKKESKKQLEHLQAQVEQLFSQGKSCLQKVGLVRYNPFSETGGNQSFCLGLLDQDGSGLVISSLHSRETTRIYAKPVNNFKEAGFLFSEEEKKAIKEAQKTK